MNSKAYKDILTRALREDIGKGDITSKALIPADKKVKALIIAKDEGVLAGILFVKDLFLIIDKAIKFKAKVKDGSLIKKGKIVATVEGRARSILAGERTALNILSHISGVATTTKEYVKRVKGYEVKVLDTRKTLPGLRMLEKYGVKTGGGVNHRMGLYNMALIKDNHLQAARRQGLGIKEVIRKAKKNVPKNKKIEIEVDTLNDFRTAIEERPDIIMLDNMKIAGMKKAVMLRNKTAKNVLLEASGNVRLDNIRGIASTGVDMISTGAITNSAKAVDFSLEITQK